MEPTWASSVPARAPAQSPGGLFLRLRTISRRWPTAADAVLAVLLIMPAGAQVLDGQPSYHLSWFNQLPVVLPLAFRRKAPILVFAWVATIPMVLSLVSGARADLDIPILVGFYTVAAHEPLRRVLICAFVVEAGAIGVALRVAPPDRFWSTMILFTGVFATAGVLGIYLRTRRAYFAALEDRAIRLERDRDQGDRIAVAEERSRIAREMHDIVAHNLSVMIALADGAVFANHQSPAQGEAIMEQVSTTGRQALDEMRRVLGILRAGGHQAGLAPPPSVDDLDDLLTTVRDAGLQTRLTVSGDAFPVRPSAQLTIYRLVQEALTNTLKHADATAADVHVHYGADHTVQVVVTDNGSGGLASAYGGAAGYARGVGASVVATVASAGVVRRSGHGLTGMRERAALFGGTVTAGPTRQGGWRVSAVLHTEGTDPTP